MEKNNEIMGLDQDGLSKIISETQFKKVNTANLETFYIDVNRAIDAKTVGHYVRRGYSPSVNMSNLNDEKMMEEAKGNKVNKDYNKRLEASIAYLNNELPRFEGPQKLHITGIDFAERYHGVTINHSAGFITFSIDDEFKSPSLQYFANADMLIIKDGSSPLDSGYKNSMKKNPTIHVFVAEKEKNTDVTNVSARYPHVLSAKSLPGYKRRI